MVGGVIVVGEMSLHTGNLDIVDAIVAQHLLGHVAACHATANGYLGIFLELVVQVGLHDIAEQGYPNEDYPDSTSGNMGEYNAIRERNR